MRWAAAVSRGAAGHPYLIYKLRKGVTPSFDTMARLCESLGFELSIGLPKDKDRPAPGLLATPLAMTIGQGLYGPARESEVVDGIDGPDTSGRTWDEVYEDVKILQEGLTGTLAGITDPRAVRMPGDQAGRLRFGSSELLRAAAPGTGTRQSRATSISARSGRGSMQSSRGIAAWCVSWGRQWSRHCRTAARFWWTTAGKSSAIVRSLSRAPVTGSLPEGRSSSPMAGS